MLIVESVVIIIDLPAIEPYACVWVVFFVFDGLFDDVSQVVAVHPVKKQGDVIFDMCQAIIGFVPAAKRLLLVDTPFEDAGKKIQKIDDLMVVIFVRQSDANLEILRVCRLFCFMR